MTFVTFNIFSGSCSKMDKKHIIPDEDLQWLLENPLPDTPGLFSKSPTWLKHSAYEIKEINKSLYICPRPGALYESYKPFDKFPQILIDFMTLLIDIDKLPKPLNMAESGQSTQEFCEMRERNLADLSLKFISKYGPLGIMHDYIERLYPRRIGNGEDDDENLIVVFNRKAYGALPVSLQNKMLPSYTEEGIINFTPMMKYDDLCSYFLPNAKGPYPEISSKEFKQGYSERVSDISFNRKKSRLAWHINKMNEFYISNDGPSDKSPYSKNTEWGIYLRESIVDIGLTFGFDKETNKWDLSWNFKSLISALSIMYIMNITGKMGSSVNICKYSKCDRIVTDRNCCCEKHDNAYRKAKERAKKGREKQCD